MNASFNALMKKSLSKCSTMLRFSVITDIVRQTSYTGGIKYYHMNSLFIFINFVKLIANILIFTSSQKIRISLFCLFFVCFFVKTIKLVNKSQKLNYFFVVALVEQLIKGYFFQVSIVHFFCVATFFFWA